MKNILKKALITTFMGLMPLGVFAFDPGVSNGPEPRVPQGPNSVACSNPGRQGIDIAIAHEGQVHCEGIHIFP